MSIVLIIITALVLFAILNFAVKARTGSFLVTPFWWRDKNGQDTSGKAGGL